MERIFEDGRKRQQDHFQYRPEIDGLRAVAVLAVIAYHASFSLMGRVIVPGGFLGVDVFFVISGYLITRIILADDPKNFSLARFYERRARRILPALVLILTACLPAAWLWMEPAQLDNFASSGIATMLFGSNFFFWLDTNYFAESIQLKPLAHTWSLSVEEQFYLVFPIALVSLRRKEANLYLVTGAVGAASLLLAQYLSTTAAAANFYLFPTRAWELLAGTVLAVAERQFGRPSAERILAKVMPALGLAVLLATFAFFDGGTPHPGFLTSIPIGATMLVIWFAGGHGLASAALSTRAVVGVGLISYSLYLWHQPLFAFARLYSINQIPQSVYAALTILAAGLAFLSWRYVEQPFRKRDLVSRRILVCCSSFAVISLIAAGTVTHLHAGFPWRMPQLAVTGRVLTGYKTVSGELCTKTCRVGDQEAKPSIVIIGDSHAHGFALSFDKALRNIGRAATVLGNGDMYVDRYPPNYAAGWVLQQSRLDANKPLVFAEETHTVILAARYTLRVENTPFDNGEGGVELLPDYHNGRSLDEKKALLDAIHRGIADLIARGKRVVLIYPVPEVGWNVPSTLGKLAMARLGRVGELSTSYEVFRRRNALVTGLFDSIPDNPNLIKVQPSRLFCDTFVKGRCATHSGTEIFYFDDDHLSEQGSDRVVSEILSLAKAKWGGLD